MTDGEVDTLKKIELADSLKDVQHLLGVANFHRRFTKDHSKVVLPLTNLKPSEWQTAPETETAQRT